MPLINIQFDNEKVKKSEALALSNAIQKTVSEATQIGDVFVYANSSEIKVNIAPIEIFIQMSENLIPNLEKLSEKIKTNLSKWKKEANFPHKINLTIIPMKWKIEIGI